ncbi:hypothetical protein GYMLUDRAFT_42829 [Collybiopsis luxurians FD-317 M1]|uniref:FAD/NAD(P)-binding domain-containing protein n=1 Tax=Collybiopsis luxurians FD-317 M1 TaxID=944289 RepID=A0A0D0C0S0_9AGAR|nr:hypothetical protein GYMLUDRAFT_42829 [Collybiopsis luxurians FD-317 M1]
MSKKVDDPKKTIVIVGGGIGGLELLNSHLSKSIDPEKHTVVLIDARPTLTHLLSTLRLVVSDKDDLTRRSILPYGDHTFRNKLAGNGRFIHGSVTEVKFGEGGPLGGGQGGSVVVDSGEEVAYDVLVLATGSAWPRPIAFPTESREAIVEHVKTRRAEFAKATDILLVGGGAVGIELAGELKDAFPSKPVTIIHRQNLLLNPTYPDKFRVAIQQQLESRGINVIVNDSILESDASYVAESCAPEVGFVTEQGKKLKPDLVVPTWGTRPNTSYLPSDVLSSSGHVKILPTFQLLAHPNVFAFGDIIDWNEQKTAVKASVFQAPMVGKNIIAYLNLVERDGTSKVILSASSTSVKYKGSLEVIGISNGKSNGLAYFNILWGIVLGGWFTCWLKAKDLMVSGLPGLTGYTP